MQKSKVKHIPLRMCVGCKTRKPREELVRLVLREDRVIVDKRKTLEGRGVSICRNKECLEKAAKNRGIERGLRIKLSDKDKEDLSESFKFQILSNK